MPILEHKKAQFERMVAEAYLHLAGDCPLLEDEAIVWAGQRLQKLERIEAVPKPRGKKK